MATGELTTVETTDASPDGLEPGVAITNSGRRSVAKMHVPGRPSGPFTTVALARLDEALTLASRESGVDFSVYLGELGEDTRAGAERLHDSIGESAADAVLIAVSPGQRVVEIITGSSARQRIQDRGAKLAVMGMVASFKEGDLVGGLVGGLRMLSDQAGPRPQR